MHYGTYYNGKIFLQCFTKIDGFVSVLTSTVQSGTEVRRSELKRFKRRTRINRIVAERSKTEYQPSSDYFNYRFPSEYVSFIDFMLI